MKTFLFYIGHPAHYHNIKWVSKQLKEKGHRLLWVVREKDVLFELVEGESYEITYIKEKAPKDKWGRVKRILKREWIMFRLMLKYRPDLAIGTDLVITHIGKILKIPSIILNEDDNEAVPLFAKWGMKYADTIIAPQSCSVKPYESKSILYQGNQELAYLHPNYFQPDKSLIKHLFGEKEKYYLLRFSSLNAHHDVGVSGINDALAYELISILEEHGKVWITSERELSKDLEPYRITIHPKQMHHALFFCSLYVGDSQTMAAEAAVLGTPSIRFNDFVGKLGYLEELEHKYALTKGIPTNAVDELLKTVRHFSGSMELQQEYVKRRQELIASTIDVTAFWLAILENYPSSLQEFRENEDFQLNFASNANSYTTTNSNGK